MKNEDYIRGKIVAMCEVMNNPVRYIDPYGYWKWTAEGFIVWENENDTWESLAALIGSNATALRQFFQGITLGPDTANRGWDPKLNVEWTAMDEEEFQRNQFLAMLMQDIDREYVPPMGGGLKVITGTDFLAISRAANASRILRQNVEHAGAGAGEAMVAHHIVAISARAAGFARYVLNKFGIGINSAENGLFLEAAVHARLHTTAYFRAVNRLLAQAKTKEEVVAVLEYIKSEVSKGTFPH